MGFSPRSNRWVAVLLALGLAVSPYPILRAADHRDAPNVNTRADGDIGDVFAFLNPNDSSRLVLLMGVNSFANPASPSYRFARDLLYQFKIDSDGDAVEDYVVQAVFEGIGATQTVKIYGPARPAHVGAKNKLLGGAPALTGNTGAALGSPSGLQAFAGLREDPFVTDLGQVFRILTGTQEVFRDLPSTPVGPLRGRAVRADGTSGTDGFGGFNGSFIVVEFPKNWVRGATSRINVWGTVSAPVPNPPGQSGIGGGRTYTQLERMGHQLINTVFVPGPLKDEFNESIPSEDVAKFSHLIPDALTINDNDGTGNTLAGRRAVLSFLGLTALPNGAPLLLPAGFANTNPGLIRAAVLPDVLRLDLDLAPNDLAIGAFGLQNGRRPGDDATDIALRLLRELADVNFPAALNGIVGFTVPGTGPARPGALNFPADRRVFVVLQGTDFYEPDAQVADLSGAGNEKTIPTVFPYLATPHPLPGEPGTVGYPPVN
jgi:hypothetical protein